GGPALPCRAGGGGSRPSAPPPPVADLERCHGRDSFGIVSRRNPLALTVLASVGRGRAVAAPGRGLSPRADVVTASRCRVAWPRAAAPWSWRRRSARCPLRGRLSSASSGRPGWGSARRSAAGKGFGKGHFPQEVSHFRGIDGFTQVQVKPCFKATLSVFRRTEGGESNQPHLVLEQSPQLAGNLIPV